MQPNDQNPRQPQQPQPTPQNQQPSHGSSMGRTLQPLSSEDNIRKETEDIHPIPVSQENSYGSEDATPTTTDYETMPPYEGGLITEPIQRPQSPLPSTAAPATTQAQAQQNTRGKTRLGITIAALLFIVAGASAYVILFSDKVSSSDLVKETYKSSSYLRPKQWQASQAVISDKDISSYGDWIGKDKSKLGSAAVIVKETPSTALLVNADDDIIKPLREQLLIRAKVDPAVSTPGGIDIADCDSRTDPVVEADTRKSGSTVGLIAITSTCTRDDGLVITTRLRMVAGKDGVVRAIAIITKERIWAMNEDSFQEILSSIDQAN